MAKTDVLLAIERELGRRSLKEFIRLAWHIVNPSTPYVPNWHIDAMCEHLEAVYRGDIRDLLIEVPPGCMKSSTVGIFWPVWCWLQEPGFAFIFGSFDHGLTIRDSEKSLRLIQSTWFRERWGDRVLLKKGDPAVGEYETTMGGYRFATSVGGKGLGRHANCVVFDDPIKAQNLTKVELEKTENWWKSTMGLRRRDPNTHRRVGIMQRLHENDLAGICEREGYQVLRLTMRYEPGWSWPGDPRTVPGELLWPARFDETTVAGIETTLGSRGAAAQLQQRPAPEGGLIFKRQWFRHWRDALDPMVEGENRVVLPEKFDTVWQSWDLAFKLTDTSDFVVGQVWGRKRADFFLLDQVKLRLDFPGTLAAIRAVSKKWPRATVKLVEDKANGSAVISTLTKELSGMIAVNPEGGKEARANAVAPLHEAGNVYYPPPEKYAWVEAHMDTMASFPTVAHDDDVDAETQALTWGLRKKSSWGSAMDNVTAGRIKLG